MARQNFGQLKALADQEGGGSFQDAVVLPANDYNLEIKAVKYSPTSGGKDQVGIKFRVLDGPHASQETWVNQTLTSDNPTSVAIFIRILTSLGVPEGAFVDGADTEELVKFIVKGTRGVGKLTVSNGKNNDGKVFQNLNSFKIGSGAVTAAPVMAAPPVAVAPPVAPVAVAPITPAAPEAQVAFVAPPVAAPVAAAVAAPIAAAVEPY